MDEVRASFQSMVFGAVTLTQALLPHFRERRAGQIINVTSIGGFSGLPGWGAYCAAKAALDLFSECLSIEAAPFNIRVLVIIPGYFSTNLFQSTSTDKDKDTPIYTQGFRTFEERPKMHVAAGQPADVDKLAARVFEVVHVVGMATHLVGAQGKPDLLRVPLGPDSGERMLS